MSFVLFFNGTKYLHFFFLSSTVAQLVWAPDKTDKHTCGMIKGHH